MEKHYTFIKAGRVENTLVFVDKDDALAQRIVEENDYDSFVWLDDADTPTRWSTYDGSVFTPVTPQYLYSIGVITTDPDAPVEEN